MFHFNTEKGVLQVFCSTLTTFRMITLLFNGHHLVYETTKQLTQHV